jgi:hypothetical protein
MVVTNEGKKLLSTVADAELTAAGTDGWVD